MLMYLSFLPLGTPQGISRMPAVLKELLTSRRPITTAKSQGTPTYSPDYIPYDEDYNEDNDKGVDVKVGILMN